MFSRLGIYLAYLVTISLCHWYSQLLFVGCWLVQSLPFGVCA